MCSISQTTYIHSRPNSQNLRGTITIWITRCTTALILLGPLVITNITAEKRPNLVLQVRSHALQCSESIVRPTRVTTP